MSEEDVYCRDCKWFRPVTYACHNPQNMKSVVAVYKSWYQPTEWAFCPIDQPAQLNAHNDCGWYAERPEEFH